jgi:hypothetical protein
MNTCTPADSALSRIPPSDHLQIPDNACYAIQKGSIMEKILGEGESFGEPVGWAKV